MTIGGPRDERRGASPGSTSHSGSGARATGAQGAAASAGGATAAPGATRADTGTGTAGGPAEQAPGASSLLPALTVPTGGGAIRGIGEKFSVNAATGTASLGVPLAVSPGRAGFGPAVELSYDSGSGNGPFGLGFHLSVPAISRKTDQGLPRYYDEDESDEYVLSGAEDLVPTRNSNGTLLELTRNLGTTAYRVRRYRPRVEGLFANIERWIHPTTRDVHWRVTTRDNVTHLYGLTTVSRIADPADPRRIFSWLLEETRDDKGNVVRYEYKPEDGKGVDPNRLSERSRFDYTSEPAAFTATAQRYLKRVHYCNQTPSANDFLMELVFDYGEHASMPSPISVPGALASFPTPEEDNDWAVRADPVSTYRSGFEVRTYRLCRRVLMFHKFEPTPLLVKSTDFTYEPGPAFTYLVGVTQAGYLNDASTGNTPFRDVLPTLRLDYRRPILNDVLSVLPKESLEGLEGGVDGARKQWVDLDGEGIAGVLIDSDYAWYYKANRGSAKLDAPRVLSSLPSPATLAGGVQQLEDLAGDGQLDLVSYESPLAGYFTRTPDGTFEALRNFRDLPNIDFQDPNLRFLDADGDGLPDILITEDHAFVWYRSKGKDGFDQAARVVNPSDDEQGPAVVFSDPEQTIQLADMSGDGLVDIVRIRNGEVSYWPNLGYGRFGKKVTLENSPTFDTPDQFDARRIRFADVDGSGTSDLFYLGASTTTLHRNESGNRLAAGEPITSLPPVDNVASLTVTDLLGTGTATLVWSTPLPGARSIFYVDLMAGKKPHLLEKVENNLGAETLITYAPSTKFYLEDKAAGTPWLTRLSFPVHVVERLERFDHISKSRLVSTYRYAHGFFDGAEREFRGFARVEQRDAEEFTVSTETELFQAPVRTVTWFHTGAWLEKERLESALSLEYFPPGPKTAADLALLVKDTHFEPDTLTTPPTIQDEREAARALRGSMLRQEIYAEDADLTGDADKAKRPYAVTEQNFAVRRIQSSSVGSHGVFLTFPRESVTVHTERNPEDPRVAHNLIVEVDDFGNVKRKVALAYARATGEPEQRRAWATLTEAEFINKDQEETWYRVGVNFETRLFELTGLDSAINLPVAGQGLVRFDELLAVIDSLDPASDLPFEATGAGATAERRLLDRAQQLFYENDLSGPLLPGELESLGLPYEGYQLAFTPGLVNFIADEATALRLAAVTSAEVASILLDTTASGGHYLQRDGGYWIRSGRLTFDPLHFYLPIESVDPFGSHYSATYDDFSLLVTSASDPLGNLVQAQNDYRVLAPAQVTDPNLNQSRVAFDALGMVVRTVLSGKAGEGDTLENPTTRLDYDLLRWQVAQKPVFVHTIVRERHVSDSLITRFQETFAYSDGFGRIVMRKLQAEPGPVPGATGTVDPRWVGTGRTVFNNKGNPVKQYEPFFSATSDFEDEATIVDAGVTPVFHYDPLDRVIRTEFPNGSESRTEFDPWRQRSFDPNDAVTGTRWLAEHQAGTGDEQRAAMLALKHADTPTTSHFDSLGRTFLVQADNGPNPSTPTGPHRLFDTRSTFDVEGNVLAVIDARGIAVLEQRYDVLGRALRLVSVDSGKQLTIADVAAKPLRTWDGRHQVHRQRYDALQRTTHVYVAQGTVERLLVRTIYGEAITDVAAAQAANLRGRVHHLYDCAGLTINVSFDFKGNLLLAGRRLAVDYETEPNWSIGENLTAPGAVLAQVQSLLELESFDTAATYDAVNRIATHTTPDGTVQRPVYNEASLLERLYVSVRSGPERLVIRNIDYNARGQRTFCEYTNPQVSTDASPVVIFHTEYFYDPETFNLAELKTFRSSTKLQHLLYTYDPIGNVVALRNQADESGTIFTGSGTIASGDGLYEYDPTYRLISATGREHPTVQPVDTEPSLGTGVPHQNDLQALQAYTETYDYDDVGNIKRVAHVAGPSGSNGWTRNYQYSTTSNRLEATSVHGSELDLSLSYTYDEHGSMTSMPHLQLMEWDYADRLKHTRPLNSIDPQDTYYTYDSSGQRVRKVFVHLGTRKERIYLGGYEIYRERSSVPGAVIDFERQTLHLLDAGRRLALVETKTREAGADVATPVSRWRFQLANHLGSATVELDETAAIISYEEYHPFGSTSFRTSDGAAGVSAKRYRYTGKERDDETGLYYHGARYYAPWLGRWTSADPSGLVDGTCLYQYAKNEPLNLVDADGRQAGPFDSLVLGKRLEELGRKITNSKPVQFAAGVGDAIGETAEGLYTGARDRLTRSTEELQAHPAVYGSLGPAGPAAAATVSEVRHQTAELKQKAADQGGGVRGWFVAVNQQFNPAYGIFEHGDKAIEAAQRGDARSFGKELTHSGTAVVATAGVAAGTASVVKGGGARAPKPHVTEPKPPAPKPKARPAAEPAAAADPPYNPREARDALEARHGSENVRSTTVPPRGAKNTGLAGSRHPSGIVFDARGFPVYDDIAAADVRISSAQVQSGNYTGQMRAATRQVRELLEANPSLASRFSADQVRAIQAGRAKIPGLTWHHHQDIGRMQLVPTDVHSAVGHIGGFEMWYGR